MVASPADDTLIRGWIQQSERVFAAGQRTEAAQWLERARAAAPEHPLVLNAMAVQRLHAGDALSARALLERAIAGDAGNPNFWINLASVFHQLGLADEEANALERTLSLEPRHLYALLQKAALLAQRGETRAAAVVYRNALQTIPRGAQLPEMLKVPLQRAVDAVKANDQELEAFLSARLQPVREQHAGDDSTRFDHCFDVLLSKRRIFTPQPTFLHFPKLPALEFYPRELFPWLAELEGATSDIRSEFERIYAEDAERLEPYITYGEGVPLNQWRELNHSRKWSVFYLWRNGQRVTENAARCPKTAAVLETLPKADVPAHAPNVFFSILAPGAHIPAHTGVTNTRLVVHLPLVIPENCRFRVGTDTRPWKAGEAWVFDDTIEHEAWNDSAEPRAVLIFDVWNPYLSPAERDLVRVITHGVGEYYESGSPSRE